MISAGFFQCLCKIIFKYLLYAVSGYHSSTWAAASNSILFTSLKGAAGAVKRDCGPLVWVGLKQKIINS